MANSFEDNNFFSVTWVSTKFKVIIEDWEQYVIIKRVLAPIRFVPFLTGTLVLNTSNNDKISCLKEDALIFVFCDFTAVV